MLRLVISAGVKKQRYVPDSIGLPSTVRVLHPRLHRSAGAELFPLMPRANLQDHFDADGRGLARYPAHARNRAHRKISPRQKLFQSQMRDQRCCSAAMVSSCAESFVSVVEKCKLPRGLPVAQTMKMYRILSVGCSLGELCFTLSPQRARCLFVLPTARGLRSSLALSPICGCRRRLRASPQLQISPDGSAVSQSRQVTTDGARIPVASVLNRNIEQSLFGSTQTAREFLKIHFTQASASLPKFAAWHATSG